MYIEVSSDIIRTWDRSIDLLCFFTRLFAHATEAGTGEREDAQVKARTFTKSELIKVHVRWCLTGVCICTLGTKYFVYTCTSILSRYCLLAFLLSCRLTSMEFFSKTVVETHTNIYECNLGTFTGFLFLRIILLSISGLHLVSGLSALVNFCLRHPHPS